MQKVISESALISRINRKLRHDGEKLRKTRGERWRVDLGDYYVVDVDRNFVVCQHVDLKQLGSELMVLMEGERLV